MTQLVEPGSRQDILDQVGDRDQATLDELRYFAWSHLPEKLQAVSRPCAEMAVGMVLRLPDGSQLQFGLRQLLLAKDAFVRSALD